ncbi:hypothetical protein [Photorhabdus asymbiotica]|uniref:hypothetical protein n=1 Tax=Photorhabdus asymbiotica TaxID=291112 RepID=UPI003DA6DCBB
MIAKVLTEDSSAITVIICHDLGLDSEAILATQQIEPMCTEILKNEMGIRSIFNKLCIVRILHYKRTGIQLVSLMITLIDTVVLRYTDVGIFVSTSTDISKKVMDIA